MKKVTIILLTVLLLFVGCTSRADTDKWEADRVSSDIKPYAKEALEAIEDYLSFEITRSDLFSAFSNLDNRLDFDDCEENNSADTAVFSAISDVYIDCQDMNDNTFRMYRDILRFQLGKSTSGETYTPPRNIYAYEKEDELLVERLKLRTFPVFDTSAHLSQNSQPPLVTMTFDLMNGVQPKDVFTHCEAFFKNVKSLQIQCDLIIYYDIYGQLSFAIDARTDTSGSYTLFLNLDTGSITEREFVEPTTDNIQKMIDAATAYVSDYTK